jgi:hypothetical protein
MAHLPPLPSLTSLPSLPSIPVLTPSALRPSAKSAATSSTRPNNTAIIVGSVVGGVVLICLLACVIIPFLLRRRRRRREGQTNGEPRSTHRRGLSGSEGGSPLLVQSLKSLNSTDVQDGHGRGSSDATPLMQFEPETGASITVDNHTRDISSRIPQRDQSTDTTTSQNTSYSHASGPARIYRDLGNSSETPLSSSALPPKLPNIPRSEPLSIMSELLPATTGNSATTDGSRSLDSTQSRGAEQQFSNVYRGLHGSSHSRTMLPNAPMKPLMENEGSGSPLSNDMNDQGGNRERWSSAADPGGSHHRPRRLPLPPQPHPYAQRPSAPSRNNSGFGLSVLTSAFRKSISASSLASAITTTEFGYSHGPLSNYPSLTSLGTTSGTGTYFTAQSDASDASDNRLGGPPGTAIRLGTVNASRPTNGPQSLSRTSLSTGYPSNPSGSNSPPPVLLAPSRSASRPLPQIQSRSHNSSNSNPRQPPDPMMNQDPRVRAHMRSPLAHRIRADPHPQPRMARKQQSTHGIIDIVER